MKRSTKYLIGAGCAVAGAALGAAGWHMSRDCLDPRRVRARQTEERRAAYLERKGPLYAQGLDWFAAFPQKEEVCIASEDGLTLRAAVLTPKDAGRRWVIAVHGHEGSRIDMAACAQHYVQQGWNALLPDLRGHGQSEGRAITMGAKEKADLLRWMEFILRREPRAEIVLHGVSMGAAACLMASGEVTPTALKAVISDCAFSSFLRQSYDMFRHRRLPALPLLLSSTVAARVWAGVSPCQTDAVRQVRRSTTPTLFIHGTDDQYVSPDMLARLCDACAAPKEWLLVPGARHADAMYRDPEGYWERVDGFLDRYLGEE